MAITDECRAFLDEHFKLENYVITKDISLKEWATLFGNRRDNLYGFQFSALLEPIYLKDTLHTIFSDPFYNEPSFFDEEDEVLLPIRELSALDYFIIQKRALITGNTFPLLQLHLDEFLLSDEYVNLFPGQTVDWWLPFTAYIQAMEPSLDLYTIDIALKIKQGIRDEFSADLDVDLSFPDDVLKEAFGSWLEARRSEDKRLHKVSMPKKKYDASDIKKWVRFRTLQYLDLLYAGLYFNCELSDDEIGHYLFRDKIEKRWVFNARDDMRTVKKYGAIIMNEWNLRALDNSLGD